MYLKTSEYDQPHESQKNKDIVETIHRKGLGGDQVGVNIAVVVFVVVYFLNLCPNCDVHVADIVVTFLRGCCYWWR